MKSANDLLIEAQNELVNVPVGTEFLVKDLFKGYVWNQIPIKIRLLLGTLFLSHVKSNAKVINPIRKTTSNQQMYEKL